MGSGSTTHGSSKKSGRATSSQKMSQPFALEDWTQYSGRSLRSGMMRSGIVYPLPQLAPLTAGTASGSSRIPTPTARDWKDGSARACRNVPVKGLLGRRVHMWPTPRAADGAKNVRSVEGAAKEVARKGLSGVDLCSAVKLWPTPVVTDSFGSRNKTAARRLGAASKHHAGTTLTDALVESGDLALVDTPKGNAVVGGALNPTWVEWLMGFPLGWTDLNVSETP